MIIDFHTHTFPDRIAASSIKVLEDTSGTLGFTDGTNKGLVESMKKAGVDMSIILPVVTNPVKTSHINRFAAEVNETTDETIMKRIHIYLAYVLLYLYLSILFFDGVNVSAVFFILDFSS